ncbi:uncharacterized protein LOC105215932 [Zeugodacus cucurbitae]|uniref:uncharacterized protein LOC105215932 n=1 Tax=Zeugodacus cucurbitae TaxID=28588 RepID=UPI0023D950F7|nr:uncharacterized protein LOC105215932 [Zeugodacus cucurbitae]
MKYIDGSYKNFYFNNVYDVCKIMRSKRNALLEFVYQQAMPYTNFNHTCPFYETYLHVKNLRLDDSKLRPMKMIMDGKYALIGTWMSNKIKRLQLELYFTWQK